MGKLDVTRRNFLQGAGVAFASMAAAGMLAGCESGNGGSEAKTDGTPAYNPSESMDVDIVVVGSGSSGVAAAVQAAQRPCCSKKARKQGVMGDSPKACSPSIRKCSTTSAWAMA